MKLRQKYFLCYTRKGSLYAKRFVNLGKRLNKNRQPAKVERTHNILGIPTPFFFFIFPLSLMKINRFTHILFRV